ncbi:hypothetical protein Syun_017594 [Stephania yunnanensis]|uniref:Uncharacterized protein n=1 Tax=Stephania yunnanensis TaxID=152371 RepID=A0AAP0P2J3_9MAGN
MSSKGGSLSGDLSWPRSRDEGARDTAVGRILEDDQEGVRTMDDDNFIDDTWNGSATGRRGSLVEGCQREVARSEVDTAQSDPGKRMSPLQIRGDFACRNSNRIKAW